MRKLTENAFCPQLGTLRMKLRGMVKEMNGNVILSSFLDDVPPRTWNI